MEVGKQEWGNEDQSMRTRIEKWENGKMGVKKYKSENQSEKTSTETWKKEQKNGNTN